MIMKAVENVNSKRKFRCEKCQIFTTAFLSENAQTTRHYPHHESFAALEESVEKGCGICCILRQGLIYGAPSVLSLQESKGSVRLERWATITNVLLDCADRQVQARLSVETINPEHLEGHVDGSLCPILR